jgi:Transposase, Mutator family
MSDDTAVSHEPGTRVRRGYHRPRPAISNSNCRRSAGPSCYRRTARTKSAGCTSSSQSSSQRRTQNGMLQRRHGLAEGVGGTGRDVPLATRNASFAQPDAEAASQAGTRSVTNSPPTFLKIGPLMDDAKSEVIAFTRFPRSHWTKIWSTDESVKACVVVGASAMCALYWRLGEDRSSLQRRWRTRSGV